MRRAVMFIMYTGLSAKCVGGQCFKAVSTDVMSAREAKNCNELVHLLITLVALYIVLKNSYVTFTCACRLVHSTCKVTRGG